MHRTNLLFALFALSALLLITPGCANLLPKSLDYQGMSAKQIHEQAQDKNASANCTRTQLAGAATVESMTFNADKGSVQSGTATVKCGNLGEITFTNGDKK